MSEVYLALLNKAMNFLEIAAIPVTRIEGK
jgi:hypothetical protein